MFICLIFRIEGIGVFSNLVEEKLSLRGKVFTSDHQNREDDNFGVKLENKVSFIFSQSSPVGLLNLLRRFSED